METSKRFRHNESAWDFGLYPNFNGCYQKEFLLITFGAKKEKTINSREIYELKFY